MGNEVSTNNSSKKRNKNKKSTSDETEIFQLLDTLCSSITSTTGCIEEVKSDDSSSTGSYEEDDEEEEYRKTRLKNSTINLKSSHSQSDIGTVSVLSSPTTTTLPIPITNKQPLASCFSKRCYFTKNGISNKSQYYEGLTLSGNIINMLPCAIDKNSNSKFCPELNDENLLRVEEVYPNQFSRLPDELVLSSGWRRISKYCSFSNKAIPDGIPYFQSKIPITESTNAHDTEEFYYLLASAIGMTRPSDVTPITKDILTLLETDYHEACESIRDKELLKDANLWILIDKFCFFSNGPINTEQDAYYEAEWQDGDTNKNTNGDKIYMKAFFTAKKTPFELYKLNETYTWPKTLAEINDCEKILDLQDHHFEQLKLLHLGCCRALPGSMLRADAWNKVLSQSFEETKGKAMDRIKKYEKTLSSKANRNGTSNIFKNERSNTPSFQQRSATPSYPQQRASTPTMEYEQNFHNYHVNNKSFSGDDQPILLNDYNNHNPSYNPIHHTSSFPLYQQSQPNLTVKTATTPTQQHPNHPLFNPLQSNTSQRSAMYHQRSVSTPSPTSRGMVNMPPSYPFSQNDIYNSERRNSQQQPYPPPYHNYPSVWQHTPSNTSLPPIPMYPHQYQIHHPNHLPPTIPSTCVTPTPSKPFLKNTWDNPFQIDSSEINDAKVEQTSGNNAANANTMVSAITSIDKNIDSHKHETAMPIVSSHSKQDNQKEATHQTNNEQDKYQNAIDTNNTPYSNNQYQEQIVRTEGSDEAEDKENYFSFSVPNANDKTSSTSSSYSETASSVSSLSQETSLKEVVQNVSNIERQELERQQRELQEQLRKEEEERKLEMKQREEQKRLYEEQQRLQEEQKRLEEQRRVQEEQQRKLEEQQRLFEEQQRKEMERRLQEEQEREKRKQEEQRRLRLKEEHQRQLEKRLEEQRRLDKERQLEEQRLEQNRKQLEEQMEKQRLEERQKQVEEQKRLEQQRLEKQRQMEEQRQLERQRQLEEEQHREELERQRQYEAQHDYDDVIDSLVDETLHDVIAQNEYQEQRDENSNIYLDSQLAVSLSISTSVSSSSSTCSSEVRKKLRNRRTFINSCLNNSEIQNLSKEMIKEYTKHEQLPPLSTLNRHRNKLVKHELRERNDTVNKPQPRSPAGNINNNGSSNGHAIKKKTSPCKIIIPDEENYSKPYPTSSKMHHPISSYTNTHNYQPSDDQDYLENSAYANSATLKSNDSNKYHNIQSLLSSSSSSSEDDNSFVEVLKSTLKRVESNDMNDVDKSKKLFQMIQQAISIDDEDAKYYGDENDVNADNYRDDEYRIQQLMKDQQHFESKRHDVREGTRNDNMLRPLQDHRPIQQEQQHNVDDKPNETTISTQKVLERKELDEEEMKNYSKLINNNELWYDDDCNSNYTENEQNDDDDNYALQENDFNAGLSLLEEIALKLEDVENTLERTATGSSEMNIAYHSKKKLELTATASTETMQSAVYHIDSKSYYDDNEGRINSIISRSLSFSPTNSDVMISEMLSEKCFDDDKNRGNDFSDHKHNAVVDDLILEECF